jgi:peptidoglycan/LPS O-acetylase OafA/YrhL
VPALDGIRGIAILWVMGMHFIPRPQRSIAESYMWAVPDMGWMGVDMFFVLSGFLITGILWDTKGTDRWLRKFYARRTLRIVPLYFLFLAFLFLVLAPLLADSRPEDVATLRGNAVWYWTYTLNLLQAFEGPDGVVLFTGHLWSLAIEEQFYLLWPWAVLTLSRRRLMSVCVLLLAVGVILRHEVTADWIVMPTRFTLTRWDGIVVGSLLALWMRGPNGWAALPRPAVMRRLAAASLPLVVYVQVVVIGPLPRLFSPFYPLFYTAAFAALIAYAATARTAGILDSRFLRTFGKYSYGLYVVHHTVKLVLWDLTGVYAAMSGTLFGQAALVAVAISLSLMIAVPLWHLLERPILGLKRYFEYERPTRESNRVLEPAT